ncbi:MAG: saccharopine dehydrogenase C-terminal domain-containing protein [Bacteroidota bacterium]
MKRILVLGAGRSSSVLIETLHRICESHGWALRVADANHTQLAERLAHLPLAEAIGLNIADEAITFEHVAWADIVISLLPAALHAAIAKHCLAGLSHLITASYVSPAMAALDADAKAAGLTFLNECGLDPGIDHMSAMQIIDRLHAEGATITGFKSLCGGLVAPACDNNPWGYKISWNPRNVVLAGQATATWLQNGRPKFRPYVQLFANPETIEIPGYGKFEGYPNRDSLAYREVYGLHNIKTLLRGTLRKPGYSKAWNLIARLGLTDDTHTITNLGNETWGSFTSMFLPIDTGLPLRENTAAYLGVSPESPEMDLLEWLGLFSDEPLGIEAKAHVTPAQVLQNLIERKWKMQDDDRDMIVMLHEFEYVLAGKNHKLSSWLVAEGADNVRTAMAKTVGLPPALATELILLGQITQRGVLLPISADIYRPLLAGLEAEGLCFTETQE